MKVVIFGENKDVIDVDMCTSNYYYLVSLENEQYGIIGTRSEYKGVQCLYCLNEGFTRGNTWNHLSTSTLGDMLKNLLNKGYVVYQFNSMLELMKYYVKINSNKDQ